MACKRVRRALRTALSSSKRPSVSVTRGSFSRIALAHGPRNRHREEGSSRARPFGSPLRASFRRVSPVAFSNQERTAAPTKRSLHYAPIPRRRETFTPRYAPIPRRRGTFTPRCAAIPRRRETFAPRYAAIPRRRETLTPRYAAIPHRREPLPPRYAPIPHRREPFIPRYAPIPQRRELFTQSYGDPASARRAPPASHLSKYLKTQGDTSR